MEISKHWKGNFKIPLIKTENPWLPLSIHKITQSSSLSYLWLISQPRGLYSGGCSYLSCPQKELCKTFQEETATTGFQERSKHSFIQQNKVKPHTGASLCKSKREHSKAETSNVSVHFSSSLMFMKAGAGAHLLHSLCCPEHSEVSSHCLQTACKWKTGI